MKSEYLFFFFVICTNILLSQSNVVLKTAILDNNPAKRSSPIFSNKEYPHTFIRADYTVDRDDNIYIANPFTEKVYKYNKGTLVDEISISSQLVANKRINTISVSCDTKGSLYVLFLDGEFFINMEKYDQNCKKINKFQLNFFGSNYVKRFFINNNDEICIGTFPVILGPDNDTRLFYLYDKDGNFIGKTNYPHATTNYYLNSAVKGKNYYIESIPKEQQKEPKDINETMLFPYDNTNDFGIKYFIGCDAKENAYTFRDNEIIMYNLKNRESKTFHVNRNNNMYNDYISDHLFMKVAPDGTVYMLSVGAKSGAIKLDTKYHIDELEYIIQKLN
ncbi:MAG: hypothetical protein HYS25_04365 [Ignavibacteriales bacterium]|nr:hypothetical protein [Ignavibacteriales bacterium]